MRKFSDSRPTRPEEGLPETDQDNQALGWEGHVNVQTDSPLLTKLLQSWPELRTGLAFSMVFVVGALVGGSLAVLTVCHKTKSR